MSNSQKGYIDYMLYLSKQETLHGPEIAMYKQFLDSLPTIEQLKQFYKEQAFAKFTGRNYYYHGARI